MSLPFSGPLGLYMVEVEPDAESRSRADFFGEMRDVGHVAGPRLAPIIMRGVAALRAHNHFATGAAMRDLPRSHDEIFVLYADICNDLRRRGILND